MECLDALQTLASCSSPPASAIARRNLRCVSSRGQRSAASIRLHLVEFQRSRVIAAVFLSSEVRAAAQPRRARRKSQDGDVELEIFKFMEQSGKPNMFPTKEELIAAGRGDLVEAAVRKGGWLTVGWDFGRPTLSGIDRARENSEIHVNGSRRKKDRASKNGSSDMDEQHLMRLNGQISKAFPPKEILVDGSSPVGSSSPASDRPSYIRNGKIRRPPRKTTSALAPIDKATTNCPEVNAEASHERWRRKRRKKTTSIAVDNSTSVKNALSWIHDMVQKREQWILDSRSKPSKSSSSKTPLTGKRDSSALSGSDDGSLSTGVTRSSSRIFPTETPARGSTKGNSLRVFSTGPSSSTESPGSLVSTTRSPSKTGQDTQDTQNPAPLTRTSSRVYSTGASALSKKPSAASISSTPESDGSKSFTSRLRTLETKLLATRAALKSGRATLLKGEDKLLQVQRKTSEDLAKAADSLEFKETEIMQTRAELRRTRAQVTALQATMALELSEARKAADEKQVLLDRAESALKMMRFVRIVWPNAASHVLLTGSFDGWTNKIKMEKSGAGVFVTALHLYPGRYEVKFIVDGTWRVDPCRPITYADGIENNVLMVS